MRGVLVDDDEAIAGLCDDVGFVNLRARCAQRPLNLIRGRFERRDSGIRRGLADIEYRLRIFGKPDGGPGSPGSKSSGASRRASPVITIPSRYRSWSKSCDGCIATGRRRALAFARTISPHPCAKGSRRFSP